ncbi:hypothetical protein GCK72_022614 [Caenorhabditis remanei]|uniref:F-box domain-containing protein n=1 Tax=Caenorhabditis remanei TaxID=31234 RepID=A0A6A5FUU8_CAERE|nr:hypothetical protein GCK72_022614 [Caenorhabditis remanei]KAF1746161.1 hypothetical protein GCK72_022614 [Caenorhabditis remanei]
MSASFPLLKLPGLPCKLVFQLLDAVDLAQLSMGFRCVKRFLTAYKTHHAAQLTWTFNDYKAFPGMLTYQRSTPFYTYMSLTVSFNGTTHLKYYFIGNNDRFRAGGPVQTVPGEWPLPIKQFRQLPNEFMMSGRQNLLEANPEGLDMEVMEKLTKHFSDIFEIDGYNLNYKRIHDFDIFKSFIWNFTQKFDTFSMSNLEINKENGRFLLENLEIDNLSLYAVNINNFNEITTVNMNQSKIEIHDCKWLSINAIIEAHNSKLVDIEIMDISNVNQLVKLVTLWKNGQKLRNLEKLKIHWTECSGIESESLRQFEEKMDDLGVRFDASRYQVERVTDGKIALLGFDLGSQFEMVLQKVEKKEEDGDHGNDDSEAEDEGDEEGDNESDIEDEDDEE